MNSKVVSIYSKNQNKHNIMQILKYYGEIKLLRFIESIDELILEKTINFKEIETYIDSEIKVYKGKLTSDINEYINNHHSLIPYMAIITILLELSNIKGFEHNLINTSNLNLYTTFITFEKVEVIIKRINQLKGDMKYEK